MTRRRRLRRELEAAGVDPATNDTEGTPSEDTWFGRGSHGWYDRLLKRLRAAGHQGGEGMAGT